MLWLIVILVLLAIVFKNYLKIILHKIKVRFTDWWNNTGTNNWF